ncbi:MAG: sigma-70 family RNA polymerase sigma factor [Deltaproteobacteria bacterium]|nr:sigma-70 family RNA polymerase sigma factor [Deltaproteobacteria bacterium]
MDRKHHLNTAEITELLDRCRIGDEAARDAVFERLYPELRKIAIGKLFGAQVGGTVTPTVLVHEAYLRLVSSDRLDVESRRHFFTSAARAMRHILIDHARRAGAEKRGGSGQRVDWTESLGGELAGLDWIDLDRALGELARIDQRSHRIVELRFFAGLKAEETAELLEISSSTLHRDWQRARAFLHTRMSP